MNGRMAITSGDMTSTHSEAKYAPGTRVVVEHATYGTREYVYVKNGSGASIAASLGVMIKNGSSDHTVALSGATSGGSRLIGVTHVAIADGYYGWVIARGAGVTVTDSGSGISANDSLKCGASGTFATGTALTEETVGFSGAAITASATGAVFLKL